MNRIYTY